jgi:hypothetical protein
MAMGLEIKNPGLAGASPWFSPWRRTYFGILPHWKAGWLKWPQALERAAFALLSGDFEGFRPRFGGLWAFFPASERFWPLSA